MVAHFRGALRRPALSHIFPVTCRRSFAVSLPDGALETLPRPDARIHASPSPLDNYIMTLFREMHSSGRLVPLPTLLQQYESHRHRVIDEHLPYESAPPAEKRIEFTADDSRVVLIAHVIAPPHEEEVMAVCSGFPIRTRVGPSGADGRTLVVTCTHTLEQIQFSMLKHANSPSASIILTHAGEVIPVAGIASALPRRDLAVLEVPAEAASKLRPLPVSPYPAQNGTALRIHNSTEMVGIGGGWQDWAGGRAKRRWTAGTLLGYRDMAWREAQPGTYDDLSHLLFSPPPTGGSSGGPIVDEDSGAVVGTVVGDRMDNIRGQRGWGIPAEAIFEMFSLPGLKLRKR